MDSYSDLLNKKEELHEDLLMYFHDMGKFKAIRHPLVYSVPHFEQQNALMNKMYLEKVSYAKKLLKEKDYAAYVFLHERPFRMNAFFDVRNKLTDKEYWELISGVWIDSENIWQLKSKWIELLTDKKRVATKSMFMSDDDRKFFDELPDKFTVYRGYDKSKDGLSYTLAKEVAEKFSKYNFTKNGKVLSREVKKSDVFAYTNERNEKEIIILK